MSNKPKCIKKNCKNDALLGEPYCDFHRFVGTPSTGVTGQGPVEPPIVISGGSVTIQFDPDTFPPLGRGKHGNPNKKIRRIQIKGDGIDFVTDTTDGNVVITIHLGDP
ncbi:MAG TPA: hypothetical protein VF611_00165 [Pyrinomonadaceae bacterium]|jgi:hypothetical protein